MLESEVSYDNDAGDFPQAPRQSLTVIRRSAPQPLQIAAPAIVEEPMPPESNVFAWQAWAERREPDVYGWKNALPANPENILATVNAAAFPFAAEWNAIRAEIVARLGEPVAAVELRNESNFGEVIPGNESWETINAVADTFPPTRGWYFQSARGPGYFTLLRLADAQGREVPGFREASQSTDSWHRADYITAASIVLAAATLGGASAGVALGSTVMGPTFAASYPAVTAAIGNAAIGAVMNGGDIEKAVKGAVIGMAGGAVAGFVGQNVIDIGAAPAVGKAAGAVVSALVTGGDPKAAAVRSLLQSGVTFDVPGKLLDTPTYGTVPDQYIGVDLFPSGNATDYFGPAPLPVDAFPLETMGPIAFAPLLEVPKMSEYVFDYAPAEIYGDAYEDYASNPAPINLDFYRDQTPVYLDFGSDGEPLYPSEPVYAAGPFVGWEEPAYPTGPIDYLPEPVPAAPVAFAPPPAASFTGIPSAPTLTLFPEQPVAEPIPRNDDFSASDVINTISSAALKGLQVWAAYKAINKPPTPNPVSRAVKPDGSVSVASNDGLIKTRKPDGTITASRPAPGVPQAAVDGSLIINNGDGTFTKISPAGASETVRYPVAAGGSGAGVNIAGFEVSPLMLAGAGVAAFLLLRRK